MGDSKNSTQTQQSSDTRRLFFTVRFKPEEGLTDGLGMVESLVKGADEAVDGVKTGINKAVESIPGLKMFIKESKKDSTSQKKYEYDSTAWDDLTDHFNESLVKLNKDSKAENFAFVQKDFSGRVTAGNDLFKEVKKNLENFKKYKVELFFIGIGQGGNVVNECLLRLGSDSAFMNENWFVKTVAYVATPFYKENHKFDNTALKGKGNVITVFNSYDITHRIVEYFEGKEIFLKYLQEVNASTLTFMIGKFQLQIFSFIKFVVTTINNLSHVELNDTKKFEDSVNKAQRDFEGQKNAVEDLLASVVNILDPVLDDLKAILDTSSLKQFEEAVKEIPDIPAKTAAAFVQAITNKAGEIIERLTKEGNQQVKKAIDQNVNRHLGNQIDNKQLKHEDIIKVSDLAALFECLKVPLETIRDAFKKIGNKSPATKELAEKIIACTGVKKFHMFGEISSTEIDVSDHDPYKHKVLEKYHQTEKMDRVMEYINGLCDGFERIAKKETADISTATEEVKAEVATLLTTMLRPMFISKEMVLGEIVSWLKDKDIGELFDADMISKILNKPFDLLKKKELVDELQWYKKITGEIDDEFNRIKQYFDRMNFDLMEDTLYFIYNSHNMIIQQISEVMVTKLKESTGIKEFEAKGENEKIQHTQTVTSDTV